jgi:hypothetical protein
MAKRWIENEEQARRAEKVLSMLAHRIRKGTASPEEIARYQRGNEDMAIWDWDQPSYQNHVPSLLREEKAQQTRGTPLIAKQQLPDREAKGPELPPLTRKPDRFAV